MADDPTKPKFWTRLLNGFCDNFGKKPHADTKMKASGEHCPCVQAKFRRVGRCNDSTDYLYLHYDICPVCGFEVYAHCDEITKIQRYVEWREDENN